MERHIVCVGGATIDRRAHTYDEVVMATSNPADMSVDFGGVAHNVAMNLSRLGHRVEFVTRVGLDIDGDAILDELVKHDLSIKHVSRSAVMPTATYLAIHAPDGDMAVAAAAMSIFDEISPDLVIPAFAAEGVEAVVIDCNLSFDTLASLRAHFPDGALVAVNPVSVLKAPRLAALDGAIDLLVANEEEARTIAPGDDPLTALLARGVGTVALTSGAGGLVVSDGTDTVEVAPMVGDAVDTTGAGDAVMAGLVDGLLGGRSLQTAAHLAAAAAAMAVESELAAPPTLTAQAMRRRAGLGQ